MKLKIKSKEIYYSVQKIHKTKPEQANGEYYSFVWLGFKAKKVYWSTEKAIAEKQKKSLHKK